MNKGSKKNYRLTELKEPSDNQLSGIMKAAAKEAKIKSEAASKRYFQGITDRIASKKIEWSKKYNISF